MSQQEISPYFIRREAEPGIAGYSAPAVEEPRLRERWIILRKRRRLIGAMVLGAVGFTALLVFNLTPVYTATSIVLIEPQTPQILQMPAATAEQPQSVEHDYYKTQYDILRSRSLAAKVIRELDLAGRPPFGEAAEPHGAGAGIRSGIAGWLGKPGASAAASDPRQVPARVIDAYLERLVIEPRVGTRLVIVKFTTPDRMLSAQIANAHVDAYIRRGMELKSDAARNAEQFLQGKLDELKDKVEKSEAALNAYRREHGVITFSLYERSKGQMLEQRLTDLNNELARLETQRIALEVQHDLIREGQADSLPAVMQNALIQQLKQQAALLAAQYAAMSSEFNPGYTPLDKLRAKLDQSRVQLAQEIQRAAREVESDYNAAAQRQQMLEQEIASVKAQALALNDASLQDAVLVREVDASRKLYKSVLERVRELDVSADAPNSNVSVVDRAAPPRFPSSPRKLLSLVLAALFGLTGGVGLAFLLEVLDDGLKSSEQVERELSLPSLALVPDFVKFNGNGYGYGARRYAAEHQGNGWAAGDGAISAKVNGEVFTVAGQSHSPVGEIYHSIRTALLFSRAGSPPKTMVVTSAVEGEGKTVTATNVALALAQTAGRVLLVDADMRKARCHEVLRLENRAGLSEVLTGQRSHQELIHQTDTGLSFLSAGTVSPNPAALLGSAAMRELLDRLGSEYDFVLLDTPPVMAVSDATSLAALADGVLMIVGTPTSKRIVRQACARLSYVGAKIFGVVLNRVTSASPDFYYYNAYSSYYSHRA